MLESKSRLGNTKRTRQNHGIASPVSLKPLSFVSLCPQAKPIRVSSKTGIPLEVLPARGPTAKQAERMARINDSDLPRVSTQARNKEESKEERRSRKQAIKEERKVSRGDGGVPSVTSQWVSDRKERQIIVTEYGPSVQENVGELQFSSFAPLLRLDFFGIWTSRVQTRSSGFRAVL